MYLEIFMHFLSFLPLEAETLLAWAGPLKTVQEALEYIDGQLFSHMHCAPEKVRIKANKTTD